MVSLSFRNLVWILRPPVFHSQLEPCDGVVFQNRRRRCNRRPRTRHAGYLGGPATSSKTPRRNSSLPGQVTRGRLEHQQSDPAGPFPRVLLRLSTSELGGERTVAIYADEIDGQADYREDRT